MSLLKQARRLRAAKKPKEALELCLEHARQKPNEAGAAFAEAGACCLRINVLSEPVDLGAAQIVRQGDVEGAEKYFRLALAHDPENVKALFGLSERLAESDPERKVFLPRLVAKQDHLLATLELGDYLRTHEKDLDGAYQCYQTAIERFPKDQSAYVKIQNICRRLGRPEEAKEWSARWKEQKTPAREKAKEITVLPGPDGWARCPGCGFRFRADDPNVLREGRHRRCGQPLVLVAR